MGKIKILCYHNISNEKYDYNNTRVFVNSFESQIKYIKKHFDVIRLSDIYDKVSKNGRDTVVITFDDGYENIYKYALPILEKYDIPATMFITTQNIGTVYGNWMDNLTRSIFEPLTNHNCYEINDDLLHGHWYTRSFEEKNNFYQDIKFLFKHISKEKRDKYEKELLNWAGLPQEINSDRRMLSEKELQCLSTNKLISLGAHSVSHSALNYIDKEEQKWEIYQSQKALEKITSQKIQLFAYPFGTNKDFSNITISILKKYGINMAVMVSDEEISYNMDRYKISRQIMPNIVGKDLDKFFTDLFTNNVQSKPCLEQNNNLFIGKIAEDETLFNTNSKFIIWGSGYWGENLFCQLQLYMLSDRVIAFGDNDENKQGKFFFDKPIYSKKEVAQLSKKEDILILVKNSKDLEICLDLYKYGFSKIHIIAR